MFSTKDLFAQALKIETPWFIERMEFDPGKGKLDIWIDFVRGSFIYFEDAGLGRACLKTLKPTPNKGKVAKFGVSNA